MWVQFSRNLYVSTIFPSIINNFLAIIVWAYFSMQSLWEYNFPCNHYLSTLFHSIYMREKFSAQSLCAILKEIGMISLKLGWVSLGHWIDVYFGSFYHCWSKAGNAMVSGVVRCRWWISWVARFTWFHTAFSLPPWLDSDQSHCWTILRAQYETQSKDLGWQECSDSADPRMKNCSDFSASKMVSNFLIGAYLMCSTHQSLHCWVEKNRRIFSRHIILRPVETKRLLYIYTQFCPRRKFIVLRIGILVRRIFCPRRDFIALGGIFYPLRDFCRPMRIAGWPRAAHPATCDRRLVKIINITNISTTNISTTNISITAQSAVCAVCFPSNRTSWDIS